MIFFVVLIDLVANLAVDLGIDGMKSIGGDVAINISR